MLQLDDYRNEIKLDEPFPISKNDKRSNYDLLITALTGLQNKHYSGNASMAHLSTDKSLWQWLKAELSIREPGLLDPVTSRAINTLLYRELAHRGRVEGVNLRRLSEQDPECDFIDARRVALYRGDILQLNVDAVVNTAAPELIGCDIPMHGCLDSEIHSQAGPWLRNDCAKLIELQKRKEQPGEAKITRGYRMPAKYIIHTCSPHIKNGKVTEKDRETLRNCYRKSLDLALEKGDIATIAFPAIGTGLNGFPPEEAVYIALKTVEDWMKASSPVLELIIFSVHHDAEVELYQQALKTWVED